MKCPDEMLTVLDALPPGLLDTSAADLHRILPGPTLIHLPGRRTPPLFVSVLQHGNETTGLLALQALLRRYQGAVLPRALSVYIGNVAAARQRVRRLDHQPDYNRIWPGADTAGLPEHAMTAEVVDQMRVRGVFASIDVHNNTGLNPHYGCISRLEPEFLQLASLFSRIVVYFRRPLGVQSAAFAPLCPAVTVECGKASERSGEEHAAEFVHAVLNLAAFSPHAVDHEQIELYHTVALVKIPPGVSFCFGSHGADLQLDPDIDHMNFRELPAGTRLGRVANGCLRPLEVLGEDGAAVDGQYVEVKDGELRLQRSVMPSMLTTDALVIRQDCLCYFMERVSLSGRPR